MTAITKLPLAPIPIQIRDSTNSVILSLPRARVHAEHPVSLEHGPHAAHQLPLYVVDSFAAEVVLWVCGDEVRDSLSLISPIPARVGCLTAQSLLSRGSLGSQQPLG